MNRNRKQPRSRRPPPPRGARKRRLHREVSAGGIVYREENGGLGVLVTQSSAHDGWIFPKGHLEHGETATDAALREVKEETGVDARIVERVGAIRYVFRARGRQVAKTAQFYLMEYAGGRTNDASPEVNAVLWVPEERVTSTLSFANEAALWAKARGLLRQRRARSA